MPAGCRSTQHRLETILKLRSLGEGSGPKHKQKRAGGGDNAHTNVCFKKMTNVCF